MSGLSGANSTVETELHRRLKHFEQAISAHSTPADAIAYSGPILYGVDKAFRTCLESARKEKRPERLAVILTTTGGIIQVAERIVAVVRQYYAEVDFYVPDAAMSAGTVLVMSGDSIHMDFFSMLGPIDPQIARGNPPMLVPALNYLLEYDRLMDLARSGRISQAEMAILLNRFDVAEIESFRQARDLTQTLLRQWLTRYKFKDWTTTTTRQVAVTAEMRERRAEEIAVQLSDIQRWHSHSRGISMSVLRDNLKLHIEDFGATPAIGRSLRAHHLLMSDYLRRLGHPAAIHFKKSFSLVEVQ